MMNTSAQLTLIYSTISPVVSLLGFDEVYMTSNNRKLVVKGVTRAPLTVVACEKSRHSAYRNEQK